MCEDCIDTWIVAAVDVAKISYEIFIAMNILAANLGQDVKDKFLQAYYSSRQDRSDEDNSLPIREEAITEEEKDDIKPRQKKE